MRWELNTCVIRQYRAEDAAALAKYANNWNVARCLVDAFPHPYTLDDAVWWIGEQLRTPDSTTFAIDVGGEAAEDSLREVGFAAGARGGRRGGGTSAAGVGRGNRGHGSDPR